MKNTIKSILGALLLASNAQAAMTTLFITQIEQTNQITIQNNETFKVLSYGGRNHSGSGIEIQKSGRTMRWDFNQSGELQPPPTTPLVLTGPAVVRLIAGYDGRDPSLPVALWLTLEITPELYDPSQTITLAPGVGGGAAITLECSTNLIAWSAATNGVYTDLSDAKFFRLKVERLR